MNLLELLHNEKVVKFLEDIDVQLKELTEPGQQEKSIFLKIILIVETLFLHDRQSKTANIGKYFARYYDNFVFRAYRLPRDRQVMDYCV